MSRKSAPTPRASSSAARSLSITASTPCSVPAPFVVTGIPPPPVQTTTAPASTSIRIADSSTIRSGWGDATTRRKWSPSRAIVHPSSALERLRPLLGVDRADRLRRRAEGGVVSVDDDLRQDRDRRPSGQAVPEFLLEHVADHALALGAEDVERVRRHVGVGERLQRQQPDLRAVSVGEHDLVRRGKRGDRRHRVARVAALHLRAQLLASPEQRVSAEGDDDPPALHDRYPPMVSASRALPVCIRFSASS